MGRNKSETRICVDIFIDSFLALDQPMNITHYTFKANLDNRAVKRNLKRFKQLGLMTYENKILDLTNDGKIIRKILMKNAKDRREKNANV